MKPSLIVLLSSAFVFGSCSIDNLRSEQREVVLANDANGSPGDQNNDGNAGPTGNNDNDNTGNNDQVANNDNVDPNADNNNVDPNAGNNNVDPNANNNNVDPNANNPGQLTPANLGINEIDACNKDAARLDCFKKYVANLAQADLDDCDVMYGNATPQETQSCLQYKAFIPGYSPVLQDITDCRANAGVEAPALCLGKWLKDFDQARYDGCEAKYGNTDENMFRCFQFYAYVPGYQPTTQDITDCKAQFQDNQLAMCISPWNNLVVQNVVDACIANEGALAANIVSCLRKGGFFKIDFAGEIAPIMNARCAGCHNGTGAKWAYNAVPATLHAAIGVAPRCTAANEAMSTILQKGSALVNHAGAAALPVNSADQNIVKKWIAEGCMSDPTVYVSP